MVWDFKGGKETAPVEMEKHLFGEGCLLGVSNVGTRGGLGPNRPRWFLAVCPTRFPPDESYRWQHLSSRSRSSIQPLLGS